MKAHFRPKCWFLESHRWRPFLPSSQRSSGPLPHRTAEPLQLTACYTYILGCYCVRRRGSKSHFGRRRAALGFPCTARTRPPSAAKTNDGATQRSTDGTCLIHTFAACGSGTRAATFSDPGEFPWPTRVLSLKRRSTGHTLLCSFKIPPSAPRVLRVDTIAPQLPRPHTGLSTVGALRAETLTSVAPFSTRM